jgi:hypothetical protein
VKNYPLFFPFKESVFCSLCWTVLSSYTVKKKKASEFICNLEKRYLFKNCFHYRINVETLKTCWVPVAIACNPSYSGDQDQEDCSLKPASANSPKTLSQKKKKITKKVWWSGSRCRP